MPTSRFTAADGSLVALADCDTFFVSCERVARPDLAGRPVVVLSNNDGCMVSLSREARCLGLRMGEPAFRVSQILERNGVAVFSSNYALYGDLSRRMMQAIASVVPETDIYSIDEAFVRLGRHAAASAQDIAREIRARVARWVGLPISMGIAPTRVLAKIATRLAKDRPEYDGVFDMSSSADVDDLLASVPVGKVWGIGRRSAMKLRGEGMCTALQLRDSDPEMIRGLLGVAGLNIVMELRGVPAIHEDVPVTRDSVISSRSLGCRVANLEILERAVSFHAALAAEKLRRRGLEATRVSVRIQTAGHAEDRPGHDEMSTLRLAVPTSDSSLIIGAARRGLARIFRNGMDYVRVLVMLTGLVDPYASPGVMPGLGLEPGLKARRRRLLRVVDSINRIHGRGTLVFASQGLGNENWHMKRSLLSPAWSTDLSSLPKVGGVPGTYILARDGKCG